MILRGLVLLLILLAPSFVSAYETMEMVSPKATGVAGSGWDQYNRIYRAYQGVTYEIQATARGGHWPYTYSLSNAPAGMTIVAGPCTDIGLACTAGTITWTNPQATASNVVVTVADSDGTQVSGTWTITVSTTIGANGFCFIDATNGNDTTGNGSLATPWQTLTKARSSCGAHSILYLRAGSYDVSAMTGGTGGDGQYGKTIAWNEASAPNIWLGYPGETVTLDHHWVSAEGNIMELDGDNQWLDNLTVTNIGNMAFHVIRGNLYGITCRKVTFSNLLNGKSGANTSFIMFKKQYPAGSGPGLSIHDRIQNVSATHITSPLSSNPSPSGSAFKIYSTDRMVVENSVLDDMLFPNGYNGEAILALKDGAKQVTVRANKICLVTGCLVGIGGNNASDDSGNLTGGELYHNASKGNDGGTYIGWEGALTLYVGLVNNAGAFTMYRNTLIGSVSAQNLTSAETGVNTFTSNVIVNQGGSGGACPQRIYCTSVTDYTKLSVNANNLQGANDGSIVNATTGALQSAYTAQYLGNTGFELSASSPSVSRRFAPLFNLRR